MNSYSTPQHLSLSLLALALSSSFAYAGTQNAELDTVRVQGSGVSATQRVHTKNMDESTATSMKDVLFSEPAVSFGGGNATSQWVTIRGMGQDQIDVKVDDTYSDTQIFHHNGRFLFDPALVKVIGVQKGTGSASAGIGATSGAILAETVDAKDLLREGQQFGFKANAGISSNKGNNKGVSVYGRSGGWDALFSGSFSDKQDYRPGKGYRGMDGSNTVHHSELGQRGLLGKISYQFNDDHRLIFSHRQEKTYGTRALREEFDFAQQCRTQGRNGPVIYRPDGSCEPNTGNNDPRYRTLTHDTTNLEYRGENLGFISKIKANVYFKHNKRVENRAYPKTGTAAEPDSKILRLEPGRGEGPLNADIRTIGANLNLDSRIADKHTLKYGINWRKQESRPSNRELWSNTAQREGRRTVQRLAGYTSNEEKTDVGIYLEGIWNAEPLTLTTGLRYDRFNIAFSDGKKTDGHNINPSLGLVYDITPALSVNSSLNYASRSPRLGEAALSGNRITHAAANLKAEKSRNAEIGIQYRPSDAFSLNASLFNQKIKDIQAVSDGIYHNGGTLKNSGYEFGTAYRLRGLTARAGMSYNKPKLDGATLDSVVTAIPVGRTWTASLAYRFDKPNLEIGWRGRYVQSSRYVVSETRGGGANVTPTKRAGYGVNDIYANWKPTGKDDLNINFAVNNIADKYYKPHSQRDSGRGSSLPETGRDFRLGINYTF